MISQLAAAFGFAQEEPDLQASLRAYETRKAEALAPEAEEKSKLREKYTTALKSTMEAATQSANLEAALAARTEMETVNRGDDVLKNPLPESAGEDLKRLRGIFATEWNKIEESERSKTAALQKTFITKLSELETTLTKAGRLDEALQAKAAREAIAEVLANSGPGGGAGPSEALDPAILKRLQEDGGKLRVAGTFMPGVPADQEGLETLPTDFIEVFAYRTAWIGIRKSGESHIVALNREKTLANANTEMRIELVGKGYDPWIVTRDNLLHRLVNWEINRPLKLRNPLVLAGGHAAGLMINSTGEAQIRDAIASGEMEVPEESLRKDIRNLYASKHAFLLVNKSGEGAVWDMRKGVKVEVPALKDATIRSADGGQDHFVVLTDSGEALSFSVYEGISTPMQIPSNPGKVVAVTAGGTATAVQLADGYWQSWGGSEQIDSLVRRAGQALDLDIYHGEGADYVIWIEPVAE